MLSIYFKYLVYSSFEESMPSDQNTGNRPRCSDNDPPKVFPPTERMFGKQKDPAGLPGYNCRLCRQRDPKEAFVGALPALPALKKEMLL